MTTDSKYHQDRAVASLCNAVDLAVEQAIGERGDTRETRKRMIREALDEAQLATKLAIQEEAARKGR